jgi:hypothetical protein
MHGQTTHITLLQRLSDRQDASAWQEFYEAWHKPEEAQR